MSTDRTPLLASPDDLENDLPRPWYKSPYLWLALGILVLCSAVLGGSLYALMESNRPKYPNQVVLIRHGEKPKDADDSGLSKKGKKRAECLRSVFGANSTFDIGMIMAEEYDEETGIRGRPFFTVKGLAEDLGLEVDVSCKREDYPCVRRAVSKFAKTSSKAVLICWKHSLLHEIAQTLGATNATPYPDDRYDIMWEMKKQKLKAKYSEHCKGIDKHVPTGEDPDLDI